MELRHLRYFVVVAEELHFARAAARLNISPSSLTEQIQTLEASLGGSLFKRTNKAVSLTGAGQRFLDEARLTIYHADHAQLVGRRAIRGEIGKINLGYTVRSACSGLIQSSLEKISGVAPACRIQYQSLEHDGPIAGAGRRASRCRIFQAACPFPNGTDWLSRWARKFSSWRCRTIIRSPRSRF